MCFYRIEHGFYGLKKISADYLWISLRDKWIYTDWEENRLYTITIYTFYTFFWLKNGAILVVFCLIFAQNGFTSTPFWAKKVSFVGIFLERDAVFLWRDAIFFVRDAIFLWRDAIFLWRDAIFLWRDAIFFCERWHFFMKRCHFFCERWHFFMKRWHFFMKGWRFFL